MLKKGGPFCEVICIKEITNAGWTPVKNIHLVNTAVKTKQRETKSIPVEHELA